MARVIMSKYNLNINRTYCISDPDQLTNEIEIQMITESGADHQVPESGGGHGQSVSDLDQRTRGWPSPTSPRLMDFTTTIGESTITMFGAWPSRDPDSHFRNVYLPYLTVRLSARSSTDFTTVCMLRVIMLNSNSDSHFCKKYLMFKLQLKCGQPNCTE